jgi:hypothetical protein
MQSIQLMTKWMHAHWEGVVANEQAPELERVANQETHTERGEQCILTRLEMLLQELAVLNDACFGFHHRAHVKLDHAAKISTLFLSNQRNGQWNTVNTDRHMRVASVRRHPQGNTHRQSPE